MLAARLAAMLSNAVAFDTETHLTQPGLAAPPLVCGSVARVVDGASRGRLLDKTATRAIFRQLLEDAGCTIVGANIAYDMLVMAADAAEVGEDLMPAIFAAYEAGRIYDLQIAEALHAVALGLLGNDPRTLKPIINPDTGKRGRYSLAYCTDVVLGRPDAKVNDLYRSSYALLEDVPQDQWPPEARQYPVDDAINSLEVALAQAGLRPRGPGIEHEWKGGRCVHCRCNPADAYRGAFCAPRAHKSENLHDLANQCYSHWAMHLGAAWGFLVDQVAVDRLESRVNEGYADGVKKLTAVGIYREDGTCDTAVLKRRVALAYGCHGDCSVCHGTGKVPAPKQKRLRCKTCSPRKTIAPDPRCGVCRGEGTVPDPKHVVGCKPCGTSGLDLDSAPVPRTDPDNPETLPGVGTGRDTLEESGDEELVELAELKKKDRIRETYLPWLRSGRAIGPDGRYRVVPLLLKPNVLLATGRTSYGEVVQLLPRKGGVRECIVARPGTAFVTVDYEAGELVTHAESTSLICDQRDGKGDLIVQALGRALVGDIKVHNAFAATVLGLTYDEYQRRYKVKEPVSVDTRTVSKWGNFGFPGRMGPAKFVVTCRKGGPDTARANGPALILDEESGDLVPGYRGMRLCILMDRAERCGIVKVREWNDRPIAPTCRACIECAVRLRARWLEQWPESKEYFDYVKWVEEHGQDIHWSDGTPALTVDGKPLPAGTIAQHYSKRLRGAERGRESGAGNAIANGWFQGLLADAAKSALRRASRECYDHTFRLPDGTRSPLFGSRLIVFTHDEIIMESPLGTLHEAAHRLSVIMVEELRRYCPHVAGAVKAEPAAMWRWTKSAVAWWRDGGARPANANDRLVPWLDPQTWWDRWTTLWGALFMEQRAAA